MVPFTITGIADLIIAAAVVTAAVRLLREYRSPILISYLIFLLSWYALVLYMLVYLYSPLFLPDEARRGYLLYNSVFIVPFHGLIAYFFVDFVFKLLERTMPRPMKVVLPVCFLIIWVFFAKEIFVRLFAETTLSRFVLTAPFSGYLVFICMFGALLYAWIAGRSLKNRGKRRGVLTYAAVTTAALLAGMLVVTGAFSFLGTGWHTGVTSMALAAVNIPGLLYLRRYFAVQSHAAAAQLAGLDLSLLETRRPLRHNAPRAGDHIARHNWQEQSRDNRRAVHLARNGKEAYIQRIPQDRSPQPRPAGEHDTGFCEQWIEINPRPSLLHPVHLIQQLQVLRQRRQAQLRPAGVHIRLFLDRLDHQAPVFWSNYPNRL
jgi:hypothetical protein